MRATKERFRHTRRGPDGRQYLIWASDGGANAGETFGLGEVPVGSRQELEIVHDQLWTPNTLADEGEGDILDVYFDAQAVRSSLFLRLYNDTPVETDTLTTLTGEVSGTGYGAITVSRGTDWTAPALDVGDMQTTMSTKQFSATGTWTDATYLVVATVGTGTAGLLIIYNALSATRSLVDGDTLDIDLDVKLA